MDPVTQAVVGGIAAQAVVLHSKGASSLRCLRVAGLCGIIGGLAPDLDILIRSAEDPLLMMHYHRHFTHALSFILIGGLLTALFAWTLLGRKEYFRKLLILSTAGYASHGFLDALTSYGTWLLWPFSDQRIGWDVIAVIDPLFTFPVLLLFIVLFYFPRKWLLVTAISWMMLYLVASQFQHQRAVKRLQLYVESTGAGIERYRVMPSLFNNLIWRAIWENHNKVHVAEIRVPWWSESCIYYSGSLPLISLDQLVRDGTTSVWGNVQWQDYSRFAHFSDGWLVAHPDVVEGWGDIRYAPQPGALRMLWGIRLGKDDQHAEFLRYERDVPMTAEHHLATILEVVKEGCYE